MAVTPEMIMQVRYEIQDVTPGLYILDDTTITYYLTKNAESIPRASLDAARAVLMRLAMTSTEEIVDIFSIKTKAQAEQYRLALQMYLANPNLNPLLNNTQAYFGGISKAEMLENNANSDNNTVTNPYTENIPSFPSKPFEV
jgi:hypothetical protein